MRYEQVDWERAGCRGVWTELFYLEGQGAAQDITPSLKRACKSCPILSECREYAIEHETQGFWGGLTMSDRAKLRALRNRRHNAA